MIEYIGRQLRPWQKDTKKSTPSRGSHDLLVCGYTSPPVVNELVITTVSFEPIHARIKYKSIVTFARSVAI
jgi:hypothetical protein